MYLKISHGPDIDGKLQVRISSDVEGPGSVYQAPIISIYCDAQGIGTRTAGIDQARWNIRTDSHSIFSKSVGRIRKWRGVVGETDQSLTQRIHHIESERN